MACLLPQDDQIITPLPLPANRPLRVLPGLAVPEQREARARFGINCPLPVFSVKVEDPNLSDTIRALWFIDPIESYLGGSLGNNGVQVSGGSTIRELKIASELIPRLRTLTDGRTHRVEVVVTDGDFETVELIDPTTMERKPFLRVKRDARTIDNVSVPVEAFRDDYLWLVEVDTTPCP